MTLDIAIVDGHGTKNRVKINGEGELPVVVHTHPPIDEDVATLPFAQFFTDDGTESGDEDMLVDGSSTPQEFYIAARADKDIFIKTISVKISDGTAVLSQYGNITALTNGLTWSFTNNKIGEFTIKSGIKTNLDFIRLGLSTPSIGDGATAFRADIGGGAGASDTYIVIIDLAQTFGLPWGLRLAKGTKDKMSFIVNDNISTLDSHDIFGFGAQL